MAYVMPGGPRFQRLNRVGFAACTGGILLVPYATVLASARTALVAQAVGILFLTLLTGAPLLRRSTRSWPPLLEGRALSVALACYSGCALLGLAVGLARGNEPALIAGQVLALGLLPVGALAASYMRTGDTAQLLSEAIVAATAVAALAHFAHLAMSTLRYRALYRLYFENNISVLGPSLLALLLAIALAATGNRLRALGAAVALLTSAFIVGAGARSLWLVAPPTVLVYLVFSGLCRRVLHPRALGRAAAVLAVIAAAVGGVLWFLEKPRPNLLPDTSFSQPFWQFPAGANVAQEPESSSGKALAWAPLDDRAIHVSKAFPVRGNRAYLLRVSLKTESAGEARVFVWWEDATGYDYMILRAGPRAGWFEAEQAGISMPSAVSAHIAVLLKHGGSGEWRLRSISVEELGPPVMATIHQQRLYWMDRVQSLLRLNPDDWRSERSFNERLGESARLLELFRAAPVGARLLGYGLGARFDFKTRWGDSPNYIHNFYLFLLYKTGVVGTVLVLTAMCLWLGFTFLAARRARDPWRRAFLWAAFSAWIGYAVWSLACPEILDFRMAPIWGFVVAVTSQTDREERGAQAGVARRA